LWSLHFISPRTGHSSSQVFEMLPAFSCILWASAFRAGLVHPNFSVGPPRKRSGTRELFRRAGSSGISWRNLFLVKNPLHRHRAGFEQQRASPFI
jgi:hypothetical protein